MEPEVGSEEYTGIKGPRIRCPRCSWQPGSSDVWVCSCLHYWNTFETGGVCPSCLKQWETTLCPECQQWSAHSDWYEY
jgi:hypothetical protein